MHYRDLRDFIAQLQSQGELRRISAPVSPHLEMTALADRVLRTGGALGGFAWGLEVKRALPAPRRQMVGPFIFFDQMGPAEFIIGKGLDVRPHPHIGLATVTYLFEGEILHRDSLGTLQPIRPGDVMILLSRRGILQERLVRALKQAGVPAAGADRLALMDSLPKEACHG